MHSSGMSIRTKSLFVLGIVVLLATIFNFGLLNYLVYPSFVNLEQLDAQKNLKRTRDAIQNELSHLSTFARDWSAWDDTYEFIKNSNQEYIDSNLTLASFTGNKLNLILYFNSDGKLIWGKMFDLDAEKYTAIEKSSSLDLSSTHPLLRHNTTKSAPAGIILTNRGPMLIASRPIIKSNQKGPIRGALVMGKFLTTPVIERLQTQTHVKFEIWPLNKKPNSPITREALAQLETGKQIALRETADNTLSAFSLFQDYENKPAILIRADTPRNITAAGIDTVKVTIIGLIVAGIITLLAMAFAIQRVVVGPLLVFTNHILEIGNSSDLSRRVRVSRSDEIGVLEKEFDTMLSNLSEARTQLLEQSYQSGVAEMASGILHNVRNQLNPLVLRLGRLRQMLSPTDTGKIDIAFSEIAADQTPPDRKSKLVDYLKLSTNNLVSRLESLHTEVEAISQQLNRVEEVIAEQDRFSHGQRVIESVKTSDAVRRAIGMIPDDVGANIPVQVDQDVDAFAPVQAESFVLTHIIQNLLMNAVDALKYENTEDGRIDVRVQMHESSEGAPMADIQIHDNGRGIEAEQLEKIFQRGFSTKQGEKHGTGLHWCANSLIGMNGRIYAESAGPRKGSVFHVLLPMSPEHQKAAA